MRVALSPPTDQCNMRATCAQDPVRRSPVRQRLNYFCFRCTIFLGADGRVAPWRCNYVFK
jgi:hypothetical protein